MGPSAACGSWSSRTTSTSRAPCGAASRPRGYAVDVALTGTDGEWLATENAYDAMVLDVMLPGLAGDELCARLRAAGRLDADPDADGHGRAEQDEARALDTGADDFLAKPFSFVVLRGPDPRAAAPRRRASGPAVLTAGDLGLDPAEHRVWRGRRRSSS